MNKPIQRSSSISPVSAPKAVAAVTAAPAVDRAALMPRRAPLNLLPTAEQISALVERGLKALSHGIIWDRGSILNTII